MCKTVLFAFMLTGIFSGHEASFCGPRFLQATGGTIKTTPTSSRNNSCLWIINHPENTITTIRILETDLGRCAPHARCCLTVNKNHLKLCNKTPTKPVVLSVRENQTTILLETTPEIDTRINFFSRDDKECGYSDFQCYDGSGCYNTTDLCKGNFVCKDHSDWIDCGLCQRDLTPCDADVRTCFDPIFERCDGTPHCPNGEDEQGCEKKRGPNKYLSVVVVVTSVCSAGFLCTLFHWIASRRGARRYLGGAPPDFPLAPFEGPGEDETSSSELITDSEYRHGGDIFEGYLQSIKKPKAVKSTPSEAVTKKSYMDLDGDDELIVLASLNVPVNMCVGLNVSREKTNLTEELARKRAESRSKTNLESRSKTNLESRSKTNLESRSSDRDEGRTKEPEPARSKSNSESNSSEWTDIEGSVASNSGIIFVRSAKKLNN